MKNHTGMSNREKLMHTRAMSLYELSERENEHNTKADPGRGFHEMCLC